MASAAMNAFTAATNKPQPQNQEELETVLSGLPRRELVALSKTHDVQATLKRESLVAKLLQVLAAQLWPAQDAGADDARAEETKDKAEETVTTTTTDAVVAVVATVESTDETMEARAETTTETSTETTTETALTESAVAASTVAAKKKTAKATTKAVAAAVVGKKTAVTTAKRAISPGKMKKATPVKPASGMTPKKTMDKIHAKQSAKQMTLQEHEQAKKKRAALLLSGSKSKFSVVKKTRSKTKEIADADGDQIGDSVAKTLSFGDAKTPVKKTVAKPAAGIAKEAASAKKKPTYKPHAGPLPAFSGDSLFSPKKVEPRPAPMAVAVMKATRTTAPKKAPATKPTAVKKATPTKKSTVKKSPVKKLPGKKSPSKKALLAEKENVVAENTVANTTTTKTSTSAVTKKTTTSARASVKCTAMAAVSQETKKEARRAQFTQDAKAKSAASRQQARAASSSRASKTKTTTTTTSS